MAARARGTFTRPGPVVVTTDEGVVARHKPQGRGGGPEPLAPPNNNPRCKIHHLLIMSSFLMNGIFLMRDPWMSEIKKTMIVSSNDDHHQVAFEEESIPLQIYPLIKEMGSGWGNMDKDIPLLFRNASGTRSLIVDVGLDQGQEFFEAADKGFELVGIEPNPRTFRKLSRRCQKNRARYCIAIPEITAVDLPLQRKPGFSYLLNIALGVKRDVLLFYPHGPVGTFLKLNETLGWEQKVKNVTVLPLDDIIQENVYFTRSMCKALNRWYWTVLGIYSYSIPYDNSLSKWIVN